MTSKRNNETESEYRERYREDTRKPVAKDVAAKRKCLGCGKMFHSSGIGNRMCRSCRSSDVYHSFDEHGLTI